MSDATQQLTPSPVVIGTAEVFLRPLRFLFDIETELAVAASASSSAIPTDGNDASLGIVHVHLAISTRPPLIERQQPDGFLRARRAGDEFDNRSDGDSDDDGGGVAHERHLGSKDTGDEELSAMKGSFVWLLVRMQQHQQLSPSRTRWLHGARVQYQITPATESFLLPVDHTNVVKLLVSDELLRQVDTNTLAFSFLASAAAAPPPPALVASAQPPPAASEAKDNPHNAKALAQLAAQELAARTTAQEAAAALAQEQTQRHQLELQHEHERAQLQQELAQRAEQSRQLTAQLESQAHGKRDLVDSVQQTAHQTEHAIELLKQRMAGDAKEREELQRRLHALEDEKLALLRKSRACALQ